MGRALLHSPHVRGVPEGQGQINSHHVDSWQSKNGGQRSLFPSCRGVPEGRGELFIIFYFIWNSSCRFLRISHPGLRPPLAEGNITMPLNQRLRSGCTTRDYSDGRGEWFLNFNLLLTCRPSELKYIDNSVQHKVLQSRRGCMSIVMQKYMISCPSGAICYALVAELKSPSPRPGFRAQSRNGHHSTRGEWRRAHLVTLCVPILFSWIEKNELKYVRPYGVFLIEK